MGDLTQFTPEESATVQAIYKYWQERNKSDPHRGYMGASQIGIECDRQLWYSFRTYEREEFSGRILRLFNRGHREEATFVEELRGIGCTVHEVDEQGNQFALSALGGHFSGHMDGAVLGVPEAPATWHVAEFKTHNNKSFTDLKNNGVAKSKPQHYQQMVVYMGLSGMTRALYLAVNKDTDELYSERIRYSATEFKQIMARAQRIIETSTAPERLTKRQDDWRCKFCGCHALCWGTANVVLPLQHPRNCRTCCHSTAKTDEQGGWWCERHKKPLASGELRIGCDVHLLLPGFVYGSTPVDATDDTIKYVTEGGEHWIQGKGHWTAEELTRVMREMLSTRDLIVELGLNDEVKDKPINPRLTRQYPWMKGERLWDGPLGQLAEAVAVYVPKELEVSQRSETNEYVAVRYGDSYTVAAFTKDEFGTIWRDKRMKEKWKHKEEESRKRGAE